MATMENHEILLTTESTGQQWSVAAWDIQSRNSVRTFKGQALAAGCLCLRCGHTLLGAAQDKPVIHVWPLSKKDESQQKIVCPGKVSVLAVSPDGLFCLASISEKIYIWEMTGGSLVGLLSDFNEATKIQFTDDGSQFVVATSSGHLNIWDFAHVVSRTSQRARGLKPRRTINAHSEPVTGLHVGCGGPAARVASSSSDGTCKLWDMLSGALLRTMVYELGVGCLIMDKQEHFLIAGLDNGDILCSPLFGQISQSEIFVSKHTTKAGERVLQGHSDGVTCLAFSSDGQRLASGSQNGKVIIWNMESGDSTSLDISGAVGNVMIIPQIVQSSAAAHQGPPISFKQQISKEEDGNGRVFNVTISDTTELPSVPDYSADMAKVLGLLSPLDQGEEEGSDQMDTSDKISSLEKEIAHLKQVNKDLYNHLAKKIVTK